MRWIPAVNPKTAQETIFCGFLYASIPWWCEPVKSIRGRAVSATSKPILQPTIYRLPRRRSECFLRSSFLLSNNLLMAWNFVINLLCCWCSAQRRGKLSPLFFRFTYSLLFFAISGIEPSLTLTSFNELFRTCVRCLKTIS